MLALTLVAAVLAVGERYLASEQQAIGKPINLGLDLRGNQHRPGGVPTARRRN